MLKSGGLKCWKILKHYIKIICEGIFLLRDAFQKKKEKNFRQLSKRWEGVTFKPKIKIGN